MLVAGGLLTVGFGVTGISAVPFTLGVVVVVLAVFSVGYLSMAKYVSNAGAFYSYVAQGISRPVGTSSRVD